MPNPWDADYEPAQMQVSSAQNPWDEDYAPAAAPKKEYDLIDVPKNMAANAAGDAVEAGVGLAHPFMHPIDTLTGLNNVRKGLLQKARRAVRGGDEGEDEKYADAAGQHYKDAYGGWENIKRSFAEKPVQSLMDLSLGFTGAGAGLRGGAKVAELAGTVGSKAITPAVAASIKAAQALGANVTTSGTRIPGAISKAGDLAGASLRDAGEMFSSVGKWTDPVNAATQVAKGVSAVAPHVIGALAHTGDVPLKEASAAGFRGGQAARDFVENIKGTANTEDAVRDALTAVEAMHKEARDAYNTGMIPVRNDKRVLQFSDIHKAIVDADKVAAFKGVSTHNSTKAIRDEIKQRVQDWEHLPPGQYHTAEGLDALKQHIGDLYDTVQPFSKEKAVLDKIYGSVWKTIQTQAPSYAGVMKRFETARESIRQLQQEMSLPGKKKTNIATALQKLQSTMRNNVNTNYGRRSQLAQRLIAMGADINPKLAGQNLQSWVPRGLGRLGAQLATHGSIGAAAAGTAGAPGAALALAATLPFMSPRIMGNAFYRSGQLRRLGKNVRARNIARGAYQANQVNENNPYAP